VRASDFKVMMRNPERPLEEPVQVDTATLFPPDPITGDTILITRLRPQWNPTALNERIKLTARASVSAGSENIRWSPVSQASYEYTRDQDEEHLAAVFAKWLEATKKISDLTGVEGARLEDLKAEFRTMEIQRCYLTDAAGNPNNFTFHVESVGVQDIPTIVKNAIVSCEVLVKKYIDIDGTIPDNVRIQEGDSRFPSVDFIFQNESHSLGNLLSTWLVDNKISDAADNVITYAGYKVPHPLRAEMFIRVGVKDGMDVDVRRQAARAAIAEGCKELVKMFRMLADRWNTLALGGPESVPETASTAASSNSSGSNNSASSSGSNNSASSSGSNNSASSSGSNNSRSTAGSSTSSSGSNNSNASNTNNSNTTA
jgi:DNA-directed RNA polymerase subunit L